VPRDGLDRHLVPVLPLPVGPIGATLCRYPPVPASDRKAGSAASAGRAIEGVVLDAARTAEVAGWLDVGGVVVPPGTVQHCPVDDGSALVLTFRYATGPRAQVIVHTAGCRTITNGVRTEAARPAVSARLDDLIR
jgi:hypothetical protein